MNEDVLNLSIRTFLKRVGVTSQREVERAVREALAAGRVKGNERLPVSVRLTCPGLGLDQAIDGEIALEE
jgi:hypothetical protein